MAENSKTPQRIQRKRTKGWKMPPNTVYVGRPTTYGNPWKVDDPPGMTAERAVDLFRRHRAPMITKKELKAIRGKDLACWCKVGEPCHADVLLEIANVSAGAAAGGESRAQ
jgi:hypothetical protein